MSTKLSRLGGGTVAASIDKAALTPETDPRTRRFGINPAVQVLDVHPRLSGRQEALIPFGHPVRFDTFPDMLTPTWDVDPESKAEPVAPRDLTAKEAVENVKATAWQSSADMGFRELHSLTPVKDDEAERLIALLWPDLDPAECRYGAENTTRLADGTEVFRCLSCSLDWLESAACESAVTGDARARQLRAEALDAYRKNEEFFKSKWVEWKGEMELRRAGKEGLARLGDGHLHVMYQLHETSPEMQAAETIARNNEAQADAMKEGFREVAKEIAKSVQTPAAPAVDVDDIIRRAKEAAKEELRAEFEAEKRSGKGSK